MNEKKVSIEIILESEDYRIDDQRWLDICREIYQEIQPEIINNDYQVQAKTIKAEKGIDVTLFNTLITVITSPGVGYAVYKLLKLLIETYERIQKDKKFRLRVEGEKLYIDAEGISEKKIDKMMQRILAAKEQEESQKAIQEEQKKKQLKA